MDPAILARDAARLASEEELAAWVKDDPALFTVVYDRYFKDIFRYLGGRLDPQTAEDLAADTFLEAFARRDRFDPQRGSLRPWLFGIATNMAASHRRREIKRYRALARSLPQPAAESHENRVVSSVAAQRARPRLAQALRSLSQGERDVVLLIALGQLSHEEVAEALGISYGTVGSRLSRARKKLHTVIDQEEIDG